MKRRENRELALKSGSNSESLIKGTPMLSIRTYLCVGVVRDVSSPTVIEPCLTADNPGYVGPHQARQEVTGSVDMAV